MAVRLTRLRWRFEADQRPNELCGLDVSGDQTAVTEWARNSREESSEPTAPPLVHHRVHVAEVVRRGGTDHDCRLRTSLITINASLTLLPAAPSLFGTRIEKRVLRHAVKTGREPGERRRRLARLVQRGAVAGPIALAALAVPA